MFRIVYSWNKNFVHLAFSSIAAKGFADHLHMSLVFLALPQKLLLILFPFRICWLSRTDICYSWKAIQRLIRFLKNICLWIYLIPWLATFDPIDIILVPIASNGAYLFLILRNLKSYLIACPINTELFKFFNVVIYQIHLDCETEISNKCELEINII